MFGGLGVGFCGMSDGADSHNMRESKVSHGCLPRDGISAERLPADGDCTKSPATKRQTTDRHYPGNDSTERQQAQHQTTNAERGHGHATKGEQSAEGDIARRNPGFHRLFKHVKPIPDTDVNQWQPEELCLAAILPRGFWS